MGRAADARGNRRLRARGLFQRFPHGLLLVGEERRVVSLNDKGRELLALDERRAESASLTCCELICRTIDRQVRIGAPCVTRRVLATGDPLPELEIEVRGRGRRRAVSVSAARVDAEDVRVLFQLRPGTGARRPGRAIADPPGGEDRPRLRIETLGRVRVEVGGQRRGGDWLDQRPGLLLKYLVCRRRGIAASDQIAEALWPDAAPHEARASLRHYVHVLREKLEPGRPKRASRSFITTQRGGYRLDAEGVWIDADEFERLAQDGLRAFAEGELELAVAVLEDAVRLCEGDFLADHPDAEWALEERERLHHLAARAYAALVEVRLATGDLKSAAGYSRRLADLEPLDVDVQRQFIEICMKQGRRSDAARRYGLLRERTLREFGEEPNFELSDLAG